MLIVVFIIDLLLLAAIIAGVMEIVNLRFAGRQHQEQLNELERDVDLLTEQAAMPTDVIINDIPVAYDKNSKTVCVEGNLVATGFIACGGHKPESDA